MFFLFLSATFARLENLTLAQAIELAKNNNYEIAIAKLDAKMRQEERSEAVGYSFGKLDLTINAIRSNDPGNVFGFKLQSKEATFDDFGFGTFIDKMSGLMNPTTYASTRSELLAHKPDELNKPDARTHYQSMLSYELPLFTGNKLNSYRKISSFMSEIATLDHQKAIAEAVFQTKKTFFDILLMQSYIKNLEVIKKNINTLENIIQNMIKEGYAKKIDIVEVQAKKAGVERMLNTSKSYKKLSLEFLSFLINQDVSSIAYMNIDSVKNTLTKKQALQNNLDLQKVRIAQKITSQNVSLQRSGYFPEVGFFAQVGTANDEFAKDISENSSYTLGVGLKWNIFSGLSDASKVEKAKLKNLQMQTKSRMAKAGVALEISKVMTQIDTLSFEEKQLKKELDLARGVFANYQERYKENLVSISDVLMKNAAELQKLLELKTVQNNKNEKIFTLEKLANKDYK